MLLSQMMANLNEDDDDAVVLYNEVMRQRAISEINTLETIEVSIKTYKH